MKLRYLFSVLAIIMMAACTGPLPEPQPEEPQPEEPQPEEPTPPTPEDPDIVKDGDKTVFIGTFATDGVLPYVWSSSDTFVANGAFSSDVTADAAAASITFKASNVNKPFCIVSPASLYNTEVGSRYDVENKRITIVIPGSKEPQLHAAGAFSAASSILAGFSNTSNVTFRSLSVVLKLTVTGASDNIREIRIKQGDGTDIAGLWDVVYTSGTDISLAPWELTSPIAYYCGEAGVSAGTEMQIVLPAYNFDKGLMISAQDVKEKFCSMTIPAAETDFSTKAGTFISKSMAFTFKDTYNVSNKEEWEAMALEMNNVSQKVPCNINITADITADDLTKIDRQMLGNIDGGNHTITRTRGMNPLFRGLKGTVKDLILAGEMNDNFNRISSLADSLHAPGVVRNVTNRINITSTRGFDPTNNINYLQIGGVVHTLNGGTMEDCKNTGNITANIDFNDGKMNIIVGGVANQIATKAEAVTVKNCSNSGKIVINATSSNNASYLEYNSMAGIVGWVRCNVNKGTITGCTNTGELTYDSKGITDIERAVAARATSVGGIVGLATAVSNSNIATNTTDDTGILLDIENCSNTATIRNNYIHYTMSGALTNKIYTGGIIGSLTGKPGTFANIRNCTNTGSLYPYDITSSDTEYFVSARPPYCHVVGGLAGFGAYLNIENCKVNCTIGNGKRPSYAFGGLMGIAYRKFTVKNTGVWVTGKWSRIENLKDNISSIGNAMKTYGTTPLNVNIDIAGSEISGCKVGGSVFTGFASAEDYTDVSPMCTNEVKFDSVESTVAGQGYTTRESDVTVSGITFIKSASEL